MYSRSTSSATVSLAAHLSITDLPTCEFYRDGSCPSVRTLSPTLAAGEVHQSERIISPSRTSLLVQHDGGVIRTGE